MPSPSSSEPHHIDPAVNLDLRKAEGPYTWERFSALMRLYGIVYHDQPEGGPCLFGMPLPQAPVCRVIRPGPTTDPEKLIIGLLKAVSADPAAFPPVDTLEAELKALGVQVRGVGHDMLGDISDCRAFTAKLLRVNELEPLEATFYPHALVEAKAKYASLYIIRVSETGEGKYLQAVDHRGIAGMACNKPANPLQIQEERARLIDCLQRKIILKLLAPVVAGGGFYQPPIWRIADEPELTSTVTANA